MQHRHTYWPEWSPWTIDTPWWTGLLILIPGHVLELVVFVGERCGFVQRDAWAGSGCSEECGTDCYHSSAVQAWGWVMLIHTVHLQLSSAPMNAKGIPWIKKKAHFFVNDVMQDIMTSVWCGNRHESVWQLTREGSKTPPLLLSIVDTLYMYCRKTQKVEHSSHISWYGPSSHVTLHTEKVIYFLIIGWSVVLLWKTNKWHY